MSLNNPFAIGQGSNEVMHPLHPYLRYPDLWRGCVGAWAPCLGAGVLKLQDNSGQGNHGTLTGMDVSDWIPSQGRIALDFDGSNDYVTCGSAVPFTDAGFSVSGWLYARTVNTWKTAVSRGNASDSARQCFVGVNGGFGPPTGGITFFSNKNGSGAIGTSAAITANRWYFFCATHIGTSAAANNLSVWSSENGWMAMTSTGGTTACDAESSSVTSIGQLCTSNPLPFDGLTDDLRQYNRVLGWSEIATLARRRGIAYELAPRRRYRTAAAGGGFKAAWALQRSAIIGGGMR